MRSGYVLDNPNPVEFEIREEMTCIFKSLECSTVKYVLS